MLHVCFVFLTAVKAGCPHPLHCFDLVAWYCTRCSTYISWHALPRDATQITRILCAWSQSKVSWCFRRLDILANWRFTLANNVLTNIPFFSATWSVKPTEASPQGLRTLWLSRKELPKHFGVCLRHLRKNSEMCVRGRVMELSAW